MTDPIKVLTQDSGMSEDLATRVLGLGEVIEAPTDTYLFRPGDPCPNFLLVLDGSVRVEHVNEAGRALVLYRLGIGDCCTITTSCLLTDTDYDVSGYVEAPVTALTVPRARFDELMDDTAEFRRFAFSVVSDRLGDLVHVIDELLVRRTDQRLIEWLLAASGNVSPIAVTHQRIAGEIGTAREVVSRLLKEFERRGWVRLSRGSVEILQIKALQRSKSDRAL